MKECSKLHGLRLPLAKIPEVIDHPYDNYSELTNARRSILGEVVIHDVGLCFEKDKCAVKSVSVYCPPAITLQPCMIVVDRTVRTISELDKEITEMAKPALEYIERIRKEGVSNVLRTLPEEVLTKYADLAKLEGVDAFLAANCPLSLAHAYMQFLDFIEYAVETIRKLDEVSRII